MKKAPSIATWGFLYQMREVGYLNLSNKKL